MQRYWLRIALGATLVFALGMGVIALTRNSIRELRALATSTRPISIPLMAIPFRLGGTQIGNVRRFDLLRRSPSDFSGIRLTVRLDDSVAAARLPACRLTILDPETFADGNGFQCIGSSDSAAQHLKLIGEIVFEPGGVVRAIFAPADHADSWRNYDSAKVQAELARLHAKDLQDSAIRAIIRADSSGALINIGPKSGPGLVQIQADPRGASLQVRDRSGRKIVHMHADSGGASLSVLADSAKDAR
jgi:hypothetical protein